MNLAPTMLTKENGTLHGYTRVIVEGIKGVGPDTIFWLTPALVHLFPDLGEGQKQLVQRLAELTEKHGEKAIGWLAYGLGNLARELEEDNRVRRVDSGITDPEKKKPRDGRPLIDPFINSFLEVFEAAGMGAAIFYARSAGIDNREEYKNKLLVVRSKMDKSLFSSALWVIQKACSARPSKSESKHRKHWFSSYQARQMLDELDGFSGHPKKQIREILNYTLGARMRGDIKGFVMPATHEVCLAGSDELLPEEAILQIQPQMEEEVSDGNSEDIPFTRETNGVYVSPLEEIPSYLFSENFEESEDEDKYGFVSSRKEAERRMEQRSLDRIIDTEEEEEEVIEDYCGEEDEFAEEEDGMFVHPTDEIPDEVLFDMSNKGEDDVAEFPHNTRLPKSFYRFEEEPVGPPSQGGFSRDDLEKEQAAEDPDSWYDPDAWIF